MDAAIIFNREVGSQDVIDGIVHIGGRTPDETVHEMCHFVEIDEPRMNKRIWGMWHGTWTPTPWDRYNNGFHEYFKTVDIEREMRVVAWHSNVCEALGLDPQTEGWIQSFRWLSGWQNLQIEEASKISWINKTIAEHRQEQRFSYENFVREWWRRNEILKSGEKVA